MVWCCCWCCCWCYCCWCFLLCCWLLLVYITRSWYHAICSQQVPLPELKEKSIVRWVCLLLQWSWLSSKKLFDRWQCAIFYWGPVSSKRRSSSIGNNVLLSCPFSYNHNDIERVWAFFRTVLSEPAANDHVPIVDQAFIVNQVGVMRKKNCMRQNFKAVLGSKTPFYAAVVFLNGAAAAADIFIIFSVSVLL